MKAKLCFILACLMLFSLVRPNSVLAETGKSEIEFAEQKGEEWINRAAFENPDLSRWKDAVLSQPETYYDLSSNLVAYLFQIEAKGEQVGYVLIGSAPTRSLLISGNSDIRSGSYKPRPADSKYKLFSGRCNTSAIGAWF